MLAVGLPLMVLAGLATYFSMRLSLRRQAAAATADAPQLTKVTRAMTYLAPLGVLVSGSFFPVPLGLVLYYLATNLWTLGQTHFLGRIVDREFADHEVVAGKQSKLKRANRTRE